MSRTISSVHFFPNSFKVALRGSAWYSSCGGALVNASYLCKHALNSIQRILASNLSNQDDRSREGITRMVGMIAHTELASTNPSQTSDFLSRVFGWEFESVGASGEMFSYRTPAGRQGSIRKTAPQEPPGSLNYVLVDDIQKAEEKIRVSGGEIVLPRVDVPQMGSFFWFKVPGGPLLACWQDPPKK